MNHLRSTMSLLMAIGAVAAVAGCGSDRPLEIPALVVPISEVAVSADEELAPDGAFKVLQLTTPDGTGQVVHPDYAEMPGWYPDKFLVTTPYADSKTAVENPSLFAKTADSTWAPFGGVKNPIAKPAKGYLSDPDMVAIPETHEIWVYYRQVTEKNTIELIRSSDGVTFSPPQAVVEGPSHTVVSPAIVRRDSTNWIMWSVNSGPAGCGANSTTVEVRHSSDGFVWSDPKPVSLTQPGYHVWHIDVQWIPSRNEYWALYNVKTPGSCATPALYLATSPDGVNWQTYVSPVLERGAIPEFTDVVYRSTFSYDPVQDKIRFWYSGARHTAGQWVWRTAFQRRTRASVFETITKKSVRALTSLASGSGSWAFDGP